MSYVLSRDSCGDDFLTPLFGEYFKNLKLPNLMNKSSFHQLVEHVPEDEIDPEITEKLDAIASTDQAAGSGVAED